jgi:RNA-directed DNA polymerase
MKHPWDPQTFASGAKAVGRSTQTVTASLAAASAIKRKHPDLPVVLTLNHLAHLSDVSSDFLQEVAHRKIDPYRVFRVKKRGVPNKVPAPPRRYRTICVPEPRLMRVQRWIAQNILQVMPSHQASFAFIKDRDLVDAAERHVGAKWLVKMDVRHFFESIHEDAAYLVFRSFGYGALLSFQMARICTRLPSHSRMDPRIRLGRGANGKPYRTHPVGHLPQGAPTSPMLANFASAVLDIRLTQLAVSENWTYTRYADDLAFSRVGSSSRGQAMQLVKQVETVLEMAGLVPHRQKTTIVPPGGRKILLGVTVDTGRPRLTKAFRNNIETHLYALNHLNIGPERHREKRGFASKIGMRRHILGLIAFAHQVDQAYAAKLYAEANRVDWSR